MPPCLYGEPVTLAEHPALRILAICASLQAKSQNRVLIESAVRLAPPGVQVVPYFQLDALPYFNPDLETEQTPNAVRQFRQALRESDALLIACPEYGHSLPGVLKNSIDWLIGSGELEHKLVAITASTNMAGRGRLGLRALRDALVPVQAEVVGGEPIVRGPEADAALSALLLAAAVEGQRLLDESIHALDDLREEMLRADDETLVLKSATERQEQTIRDARRALDAVRALAAELDISRATAEAELTHLAQQSLDAVQADLDTIAVEVAEMEAQGIHAPDARVIRRAVAAAAEDPEGDEVPADDAAVDAASGAEAVAADAAVAEAAQAAMTAEEAITELRTQIERLGPVNMMAIQQYAEMDERRVFLGTQRKDLIDSIAQTNEAIRKIDRETRSRFRDTFDQINRGLQALFPKVFGGGHAELVLTSDELLDSGVAIMAQPPGKRNSTIHLLSGGEKALTAISFIFSIFELNPAPFCVLDEVDAPLDDNNVIRLCEMLRSMSRSVQFMFITHNKITMEIAEQLIGVTMQEAGVSRLVAVNMEEAVQLAATA